MLDFATNDYERQIIARLLEEPKDVDGRLLRRLNDEEYAVVCRVFLRALEESRRLGIRAYAAVERRDGEHDLQNN